MYAKRDSGKHCWITASRSILRELLHYSIMKHITSLRTWYIGPCCITASWSILRVCKRDLLCINLIGYCMDRWKWKVTHVWGTFGLLVFKVSWGYIQFYCLKVACDSKSAGRTSTGYLDNIWSLPSDHIHSCICFASSFALCASVVALSWNSSRHRSYTPICQTRGPWMLTICLTTMLGMGD